MRQAEHDARRGGAAARRALALSLVLACGHSAAAVRADRWRWSNPQPHGNNVLDLYVGSSLSAQVGDGGSIYIKGADGRWAPAYSGVSAYLRSVTALGGRLVVTGEGGCILWSDDGASFYAAQLATSTSDWFEGVTASSQRAVAVGDNGSIYTSTNGLSWAKATSGTTEWLRGVAFGGGAYVAVGEYGKILRSTSGTSWSAVSSGTSANLNRVRYVGSGASARFITVGDRGVALSSATGAAPWTSLASGTTNNLFDVAVNESGTLLAGDQQLRYKPAGGTTWTNQISVAGTNGPPPWIYLSAVGAANTWTVAGRTGLLVEGVCAGSACSWQTLDDSPRAWLWDVTVQNGLTVAVGDLANIQTSLDGILWAREGVPVARTNVVLLGVGGTSNLLVAAGSAGTVLLSAAGTVEWAVTNTIDGTEVVTQESADAFGVVWSKLPPFTTNTLQGVAAADGLFVATGDAGKIYTSADGSNWVVRSSPTTSFLSGVAIGTNACVAVGANGVLLRGSRDGVTWTSVPLGTTDWLYRVRWLDGQFVVVGQNGRIYTSPDAVHWNLRASGTTRWLTDVASADGTWYATGYQGCLLASTNGTAWSAVAVPTVKSLYGAASRGGRLLLAGVEGVVLRNPVVPLLTPVSFLGYDVNVAVSADTPSTVYELFLVGGEPDQIISFESEDNLGAGEWTARATMELYDPSGTLFFLRTRDADAAPARVFYRAPLVP